MKLRRHLLLVPALLLVAWGWRTASVSDPASGAPAKIDAAGPVPAGPTHPSSDPRLAAGAALTIDDESAIADLAHLVATMDAAEAREFLCDLALEDLRGEAGRLLVRRWTELEPAAATQWVSALHDSTSREELSSAAALAWSEHDLPAALAWAHALPSGISQHRVLTELGTELARTDPAASLGLAAKLPAGDARAALELHAVRQWASADADAAVAWATRLAPGSQREEALAAVALALASGNGERASRFVAERMSPGPESYRAVVGVVQRWVQTDRRAAQHWTGRFPPGPLREAALAVLPVEPSPASTH